MAKIMLIDDDLEVLDINCKYFQKKGYCVSTQNSAIHAIKAIPDFQPDCIILDVMLPELSGFDAFPKIRKITKAPVIFLTGRTEENDKITGLLLGADDYMVKPYSLRELEARIIVQLRKNTATSSSSRLEFPPLSIDTTSHKVFYNDSEEISISKREYEFLYLLAVKPQETLLFQTIGEAFWGTYSEADRRTIMVIASRVRKKLSSYKGLENYIETVWSKGYKFTPR